MPGAFISTRRRSASSIGPLPSIGLPRASTTRPSRPLPIGTSTIVPVRRGGRTFANVRVRAEDDDADVVGFEVQGHALHTAVELDHLTGLDVVEAVDAGDAVADGQHGADFGDLRIGIEIRDLVADNAGNFCGADIHIQPFIASASLLSLVRMDASIIWLPILITIPPRISGSMRVSIATSRPARVRSCCLSAASWSSFSA